MINNSGSSVSAWMSIPDLHFTALQEDREADVCVVGAGIAGLSAARELSRAGKKVVVLEAGEPGGGQTGRTTAHLASALDDGFRELERIHGEDGARLAAQSHRAAIDHMEKIAREERIACDLHRVDGYLFLGEGQPVTLLEQELAAALRAGMEGTTLLPRAPLSFDTGPCLRFPRQGQLHPMKYLAGILRSLQRADRSMIYHRTAVTEVHGGARPRVETADGHAVRCGAVVVATNSPINDRFAIHTKQAPYTTYVIAARVPRGSVPRALYWDTLDPYHYVRLQHYPPQDGEQDLGSYDLLIVGGEDHKTGQADDQEARYQRLYQWAKERFPVENVEYRWSGQVMEPSDGLAFIGKNPTAEENVYIATGDSGHGMTHGVIAGLLLTDLILGRESPWAKLYAPSRKSLRSLGELVRENLNVALQLKDWVTAGDVESADQVAPGTGAVLRRGLRKIAVYRDPAGAIHERSAACPHLGCVVSWNGAEKMWDCPCHGSQFDAYGKVVNGPADRDLAHLDDSKPEPLLLKDLEQRAGAGE